MTLQSSGAISISQINTEVSSVNSNSLRALSAAASKSAPDSMTEFHGYSHANPIPTSKVMRNMGSGLGAQSYRTITSAIVALYVRQYHRFYNDGCFFYWQIKYDGSEGGCFWISSEREMALPWIISRNFELNFPLNIFAVRYYFL